MSIVWDGHEADDPTNEFSAKWYLNGFPKSGLHLAVQFMRPFVRLMPPGQLHPIPWVGSFRYGSWSDQWQDIEVQLYNLARCKPGHYFKGHCAWREDIEHFMHLAGLAHVFIYRDPRDVAVSQAHHIMSDRTELKHPGREEFLALGGFDEILTAVIEGLGVYPGVMDRWELYAPWLEVDWVFKFRFEDALFDPVGMATSLIEYGLHRIGRIFKFELRPDADSMGNMVEAMVEAAIDKKEDALTFRKGTIGDWQTEMTPKHKELFKKTDVNDWLIRLGYEKDRAW